MNRLQNDVNELKEQIHGKKERKNSKNTRIRNKALQNDVNELKEQIHGMKERKNSKNTRMRNKALQNDVNELKEQIHGMKERKNSKNTRMRNKALQNDRKVKLYTGLPNKSAFENMYEHMLPRAKQLDI